jgi:glycosyltransferase involved in cell wall biosynthesis
LTPVSTAIRILSTEPTASRSIWDVFGVQREFELVSVRLPLRQKRLDTRIGEAVLRIVRASVYPVVAARLLLRNRRFLGLTVLYAKNYGLVPGFLFARLLRPRNTMVVFEAHVPPRNRFQRWVLKHVDGTVCNGYAVRRVLLEQGAVQAARSMAVHQGFDQSAYPLSNRVESRRQARRRLGWTENDKVIVYTGKVYWPYEEVNILLRVASLLVADGIRLVVVGGRADHARRWREEALSRNLGNASFVGFVAPSEVADYQTAADVLISCYPSGIDLNNYRSPGKLFEYMASGTPIVASDYASLREVLRDGANALLVEPDKPELLAHAICQLTSEPAVAARLGNQAREDASQYTWAARAEAISAFVSGLERK